MIPPTIEIVTALRNSLVSEHSAAPGMFGELARIERLLAETYRNRVQYELLQNSDDAGADLVELSISEDGQLKWRNNGRPLTQSDIESLCRSASSTKRRGQTIGYRGIGFKSLAAVAETIDVETANVRFSFNRADSSRLLSEIGNEIKSDDAPLIRIPVRIGACETERHVSFTIAPKAEANILITIDPISLLFLRNITEMRTATPNEIDRITITRNDDKVQISWSDGDAKFGILSNETSKLALPLNPDALALAGPSGRLACFLPLADQISIPAIASGDLTTDPSRTHAITDDPTTRSTLRGAAKLLAHQLARPDSRFFSQAWRLLLDSNDLRAPLSVPSETTEYLFLSELRTALKLESPPFEVSPFYINPDDISILFPKGAPGALYSQENSRQAQVLRTALGLQGVDLKRTILPHLSELSANTRANAAAYVRKQLEALGRPATEDELKIVESSKDSGHSIPNDRNENGHSLESFKFVDYDESCNPGSSPHHTTGHSFGEVVNRWRVAEIAVADWLNNKGWHVEDVSRQNLGYDLLGTDTEGARVLIEVKKVTRIDARFSMTNNEMGATQSGLGSYYLAIVIGDGQNSRIMLLDPNDRRLRKDRVCRAWEWQFEAWSKFGIFID